MRNFFSPALSMRATLRKYTGGFTLVELIVVVTIIAILSAIWLLSFSGYSSGARDSTRVEDLANMQKSLAIYATTSVNGKYPTPDNGVQILNGGVLMNTQGYAWKSTLSTIRFNGAGLDPLDTTYYTYSVNKTQTGFALMAYLENASNLTLTSYIEKSLAATTDYSTRYPMVSGNPIGVLIASGSLQPVQATASAPIELTTSTTPYTAYIASKNTVTWSGASFATNLMTSVAVATTGTGGTSSGGYIAGQSYNSTLTYTAGQTFTYSGVTVTVGGTGTWTGSTKALSTCDTNDIVVWSWSLIQVWSACNMGATNASTWATGVSCSGSADCNLAYRNTWGSIYQWGRNDDVTVAWTPQSAAASGLNMTTLSIGNTTFYNNDGNGDWYTPDSGLTNPGLWNPSGTTSSVAGNNQWPCPTGYYVPTGGTTDATTDWGKLYTIEGGSYANIQNALKVPLAGWRSYSNGYYFYSTTYAFYWSSSPSSTYSYTALIAPGGDIAHSYPRAAGCSIRCLRH